MDYNSKLKSLRTIKNQTVKKLQELEKKEELEEDKQLKEEKYSRELYKQIVDLYNYTKLIEKNGTMDSKIFHVITELIAIFEGENYVCQRLNYHKEKTSKTAYRETIMILSKNLYDNIKSTSYPKRITERYFHHLLKNGLAIKIVDEWSAFFLPNEFSFYETGKIGTINPQISFKGFPYIKEFIDYIINYRIDNNIEKLSEEEMHILKDKFILLNIDNIQNNYQLTTEQKIKEATEYINLEHIHKQKVLKRIVKKIEDNK